MKFSKSISHALVAFTLGSVVLPANAFLNRPVDMIKDTVPFELSKGTNKPNKVVRVILADFKDEHNNSSAKGLASEALEGQVKRVLNKSAEMVDLSRDMRKKLQEEIQIIEMNGDSEFVPPQAANLAVGGSIHNAHVDTRFVPAHKKFDLMKAEHVPVPDQCVVEATVGGNVVFYNVNPVALEESVAFNGVDVIETSPPAGSTNCVEPSDAQKRTMIKKAMMAGLESIEPVIKTMVAGRGSVEKAFIHTKKKKVYYQISIHPNTGALPGTKVQFLEMKEFNGRKSAEPIAEGKVACTTKSKDWAFVELKKKADQELIKQGTMVKLVFKKGWLNSLVKTKTSGTGINQITGMLGLGGCKI